MRPVDWRPLITPVREGLVMFFFTRRREQAAFAPLLDLARAKAPAEQRDWFEDLRAEAPTVVARLEYLLAREARLGDLR